MERFKRQKIDTSRLPGHVCEKWSEKALDEGFVPFPKKLVRKLTKLFPDAKAVNELAALLAVVDFRRPNLSRLPSVEYLSFLAGMSAMHFEEALGSLEDRGYLVVTRTDQGLRISLDGLVSKLEIEDA